MRPFSISYDSVSLKEKGNIQVYKLINISDSEKTITGNDDYGRRDDDDEFDGESDSDRCIDFKAMCMAVMAVI